MARAGEKNFQEILAFYFPGAKIKQYTGEPAPLRAQLAALVRAEKLCEAENLLFEALEAEDPEVLPAALEFYRALNGLPDETLERCGFPRDEILSGLREVCSLCGLDLSALD